MTEEMEEKQTTTSYEDYKFLTKNDLEKINASHLVGSKLLKPYMHGYFMSHKQYLKLKEVSDPFAYDKYRKNKISEKLEELRENRIVFQRTLPKVNSKFMEDVLNTDMKRSKKAQRSKQKDEMTKDLLEDERFGKMYKDRDFQIDMNSEAYKQNKPKQAKYARDDSDEDQPEEETGALDIILGDTVKASEKKKEFNNRVNKQKMSERITPIAEFKRKDNFKNAKDKKRDTKVKMMKGRKVPTAQEMRERKKHRRIAIPLSKFTAPKR